MPVTPGGAAWLGSTTCCRIDSSDAGKYDEELAFCPRRPGGELCPDDVTDNDRECQCPAGTSRVVPGLAVEPVCPVWRCVLNAQARVVSDTPLSVLIGLNELRTGREPGAYSALGRGLVDLLEMSVGTLEMEPEKLTRTRLVGARFGAALHRLP